MNPGDTRPLSRLRQGCRKVPLSIYFVALGAVVLIAAIWSAALVTIERERKVELAEAQQETANLATAFEEHSVRTIRTVEALLSRILDVAERRGLEAAQHEMTVLYAANEELLTVMSVTDRDGNIAASSLAAGSVNVAHRVHFRAHAERADAGLVFGVPVQGQRTGQWTMHMARRINQPDGSFGGIVTAGVQLDYFNKFYREIELGEGGLVTLLGRDGHLRARGDSREITAAHSLRETSQIIERVELGAMRGSLVDASTTDGVRRIVSFRVLPGYPLIVTVGMSEAEALRSFGATRLNYIFSAGALTALVLLLAAATGALLWQQMRSNEQLRASESRFRAYTNLGADWYWESDSEHRLAFASDGVSRWIGAAWTTLAGRTLREAGFVPADTSPREARKTIEVSEPFRDSQVRYVAPGGEVNYFSVSGEPMHGDDERTAGYRGICRDITSEMRLQHRLRLQNEAARLLTSSRPVDEVITEMLREICATFGWVWGVRRVVDREVGTLTCAESWCVPELEASEIVQVTRATVYPFRPDGIIASAIETGEPLWRAGVSGFPFSRRADLARKAGIREVVVLPIPHGDSTRCVLQFCSRHPEYPDPISLATLRAVAAEIAQFLAGRAAQAEREQLQRERLRVEELERQAQLRLSELIDSIEGIVWEADARTFEFTYVNGQAERILGYPKQQWFSPKFWLEHLHPEDRERAASFCLSAVTACKDHILEYRMLAADGRAVWLRDWVSVVSENGQPLQLRGLMVDISERKRAEQELERKTALAQLLEALARAANEAATPEEAMQVCLARICEHGGWELGRLGKYASGEGGFVPGLSVWHEKHPGRYAAFKAASLDDRNFSHLGHFITAVLRENKPVWRDDIPRRAGTGRHGIAAACGLGSAFAFPVSVHGKVVAFLEFYAEEPRAPDTLLMEASTSVGAMLARLIERHQAVEERERLATIVESSGDAIWSRAADHTLLSWNAAAERLFRWERGEVIGRRDSFLVPADRLHERQLIPDSLARGEDSVTFETVRLRKDGTPIDVQIRGSVVRDESGNVIWTSFIAHDITERKLTEQELKRRTALAQLLEALARAVNEATTPAAAVQACLERICGYGGWDLGHFAPIPAGETGANPYTPCWYAPHDAERYADVMRHCGDVLVAREHPVRRFSAAALHTRKPVWIADLSQIDGMTRLRFAVQAGLRAAFGFPVFVGDEAVAFVEFFAADAREPDAALLAAGDSIAAQLARLIERDRAFRAAAQLAAIVENATVAIFTRTLEGTILSWNPGAERLLGYSAAEAIGKSSTFNVPPGRPPNLTRNNESLLRGEVVAHESDRITRDGRVIDVLTSHSPLRDGAGNIVGASVILQDITALKRAQAAVTESEERFRTIFDHAAFGITLRAPFDDHYTVVNPAFADMLGYTPEETVSMSLRDFAHPDELAQIQENRDRALRGEIKGVSGERRLIHKDGSVLWANRTMTLVRTASGEPRHLIGVFEDISERKRAEDALRESEARYRTLVEHSPYCIHELDLQGRVTRMNRAGLKMMGVEDESEILGLGYLKTVAEADRARIGGLLERALRGEASEFEFAAANGRSFQSSFVPIRDPHGALRRLMGLTQDITERRRAEFELERTTALARLLEGLARAVNEAFTADAAVQACLQRMCAHGGWAVGHFAQMPGWEIGDNPHSSIWHLPPDAERYAELVRRGDTVIGTRTGGGQFAARAIREKRPLWITDLAQTDGIFRLKSATQAGLRSAFGFPVFVGDEAVAFVEFFAADAREPDEALIAAGGSIAAQLARLIERDRAFRAAAQLAAIVETATVAIFTRTLDGTILSWNPGAEKMLGYTAAEAIGRQVGFMLPPDRPNHVARNNEGLLRGEVVAHESDRITRDGRVIDVLTSHASIRDGAGNIVGASVVLQDITALKRAQTAVRESEERFRTIFEYAPSGIVQSDTFDYRFTAVNPAFARMLGYTQDELIGMQSSPLLHPDEPVDIKENRERMLRGELERVAGEQRMLRKDGGMIWVNRTVVPVRTATGDPRHFIGVYEDITERKSAETALRDYSGRLQVLSRKVLEAQETERASIARELHDQLGQTLSAAKLNLQVFQRRHKGAPSAASLKDTIDTVDQALQQVRTLALDLRPPQLDDLGLGTTLRSYAERLAKPARLKLHFAAGELPGLPPQIDIACFRVAQGALTNVVRHARAANVWVTLAVEEGMLCLRVRDDGSGCDLRRAQRQAGRGYSMGLLSMEERTRLAGGEFTIRSEPGAGMEVHAHFPIAVEAVAMAEEP